jgi:nicotinamide-nucleotide amidase
VKVDQSIYSQNPHKDVNPDSARDAYYSRSLELATTLSARLRDLGITITTAESCTGGMLSAALTEIPGSSAWFQRGAITYSNTAKSALLGVPSALIEAHGAVSEACVIAMARGALAQDGANVAVSISGVAGPDGATADKPVGTVWIGWAWIVCSADTQSTPQSLADTAGAIDNCKITAERFQFKGQRRDVREQAVLQALRGTITRLPERIDER